MKKIVILICVLVPLTSVLQAQTKWTLRQCIDYAIEHNIEIKQQAVAVENSEIDLNTTKSSRLPDLNGGIDHGYNFGRSPSPATGIYEAMSAANTNFSLASNTPLFTGFRISNQIKANELNLQAATEGLKKAKENMELKVASLFLDVLFKKEILKVYKDQVALSSNEVVKTTALVEAGKVPSSQLYDIKAQLAKDELNTTIADNDLTITLLNLSQALNLQEFKTFDIAEPNLGQDIVMQNLSSIIPPDQVYKLAVANRPHVKEFEYKLESSKKGLKVAQSGYWPTLNFRMSYGTGFSHVYNAVLPNDPISDQLDYNARQFIGLSLSIPIFDRFQTRNQVKNARLNIQNMELSLDNIKLALYQEIQQAYQSAVAAQSKYSSTEKAYLAAEESFKYAQERYDLGKFTVFEYNAAQNKLFNSRSEQIQAKYDFLFRAKILDFYRGEEINID